MHIAFYEFSMRHRIKIQISGEHDFYGNYTRKCTLVQALRFCKGRTAHRGSRSIAILFLDHGTRRGEGSGSRPGRFLPPGNTRYPFYRRLGGPQGPSGQMWKISPPTLIRSPDRPARSQSLYRLSYPAHNYTRNLSKIWRRL